MPAFFPKETTESTTASYKLEDEQRKINAVSRSLSDLSKAHVKKDITGFAKVDLHIASVIDVAANLHQLISSIEKGGVFDSGGTWVETGKFSHEEVASLKQELSASLEEQKKFLTEKSEIIVNSFPEEQKGKAKEQTDAVKTLHTDAINHLATLTAHAESQLRSSGPVAK